MSGILNGVTPFKWTSTHITFCQCSSPLRYTNIWTELHLATIQERTSTPSVELPVYLVECFLLWCQGLSNGVSRTSLFTCLLISLLYSSLFCPYKQSAQSQHFHKWMFLVLEFALITFYLWLFVLIVVLFQMVMVRWWYPYFYILLSALGNVGWRDKVQTVISDQCLYTTFQQVFTKWFTGKKLK